MSLRVMMVPDDEKPKDTESFEKEEDSSDGESESSFGTETHESVPVEEGNAFIILLKKEPEKKEEGNKEMEDLTGGSFKEMFKKGREAVISKANGECKHGVF